MGLKHDAQIRGSRIADELMVDVQPTEAMGPAFKSRDITAGQVTRLVHSITPGILGHRRGRAGRTTWDWESADGRTGYALTRWPQGGGVLSRTDLTLAVELDRQRQARTAEAIAEMDAAIRALSQVILAGGDEAEARARCDAAVQAVKDCR